MWQSSGGCTYIYYFIDRVCSNIARYLPNYKEHIKKLKGDDFTVIGYARKSPGPENDEVRIRLLQAMVDRLYERSLVQTVFVSPCCKASDSMEARDSNVNQKILKSISRVQGTTNDMIEYLKKYDKKVCLVVIDFAGLSTNCRDLHNFIKEHENLEKIIVDSLLWENEVTIFERNEVISNPELLQAFNCRKKPVHRSK
ncbi:hypothetical protein BCV72DRAFT_107437 [Rhizopus microsporus var. microsporus]|uniref:PARP catalytic domain-containing protein n=1 Tax=Rhizopus microsporus var. microsporus TaxID=86635 RepID=A0A1X0QLT9_RHIZD|nr:hypothetical protein BCV72DRAFT_107437 [Rhizopus microsporus var. microsporus]